MAAGYNSEEEDKKLKASGTAYLVGDVSGIAAGLARNKGWGSVAGFATWLAGGAAAARYGSPKDEILLRQQAIKLQDYLKSEGVDIPSDIQAQHELLKTPGFIEKVENFLYKHPSEALNTMFGVGALGFLHEGVSQIKSKEKHLFPKALNQQAFQKVSNKTWMGALILAGALGGLLIKEDKDARDNAKDGNAFERAWAFVKEKPLRLTGGLYGANNLFAINDAYSDFKDFKAGKKYQGKLFKPHYFSTVVAASYVFANVMLSLSSREQSVKGGFSPEQVAELEKATVSVLAAQPPEAQAKLLQGASEFLASEKDINIPAEQLAQDMANRITEITKDRLGDAVAQTHMAAKQGRESERQPKHSQQTSAAEMASSANVSASSRHGRPEKGFLEKEQVRRAEAEQGPSISI